MYVLGPSCRLFKLYRYTRNGLLFPTERTFMRPKYRYLDNIFICAQLRYEVVDVLGKSSWPCWSMPKSRRREVNLKSIEVTCVSSSKSLELSSTSREDTRAEIRKSLEVSTTIVDRGNKN